MAIAVSLNPRDLLRAVQHGNRATRREAERNLMKLGGVSKVSIYPAAGGPRVVAKGGNPPIEVLAERLRKMLGGVK